MYLIQLSLKQVECGLLEIDGFQGYLRVSCINKNKHPQYNLNTVEHDFRCN